MSELYPGQTAVVRGKLAQLNMSQQADEEELKATADPNARASLLRRIAGRHAQREGYRRQLAKCTDEDYTDERPDSNRTTTIRVRLSPDEEERLRAAAAEAGSSLSAFIRGRCGL